MKTKSQLLRAAIKKRFYPFAAQSGFTREKANAIFCRFHRKSGDRVHWFEVQWDKYNRPMFVINFSDFAVGEEVLLDSKTMDVLTNPYALPRSRIGRLQRCPGGGLSAWFQPRKPLKDAILSFSLESSADEVVEQVISCFSELETWWDTKVEGPHIEIQF